MKKALIRAESVGRVPPLDLPFERDPRKLIKVKLEIDANPPAGSDHETRYIAFPLTAALTTQTLGSGFGMKLAALLRRPCRISSCCGTPWNSTAPGPEGEYLPIPRGSQGD